MGFLNFIYRSLRTSSLPQCLHGQETWALVTGGSDGIGKGFVEELLSRGFNVFIHGRTEPKLLSLQEALKSQYPDRKVEVLCYDAGSSDVQANISSIMTRIKDYNITVLVNNVGYQSHWTPFAFQSPSEAQTVIRVESDFPTLLTHALLPVLANNEPAVIVNIGGLTSLYPAPFLAAHAGAKAYIVAFTEALALEMKYFNQWRPKEQTHWTALLAGTGNETDPSSAAENGGQSSANASHTKAPRIFIHAINVQNVSSSSNLSKSSFFIPTSRRMAQAALDIVGCGQVFVTAYWRHAITGALLKMTPRWVVQSAMVKEIGRLRQLEDERPDKRDV